MPDRLLDEACLADLDGHDGLSLLDVLRQARAPYDQALARHRQQKQAQAQERERLRESPDAMREHLRRHEPELRPYSEAIGEQRAEAFALLIASTAALAPAETAALREIADDLRDTLLEPYLHTLPEPGAGAIDALGLLAEHYRSSQRATVEDLAREYGQAPSLRRAAQTLQRGELLTERAVEYLAAGAERDHERRTEQHERQRHYLAWRERTAQRLLREAGPLGRLTHRKEEFYPQLDAAHVAVCSQCHEFLYPIPDPYRPAGDLQPVHLCPYCGSGAHLTPYRPRTESEA